MTTTSDTYPIDDLISLELGRQESSAVLIGPADTIAGLLRAALDALDPLP